MELDEGTKLPLSKGAHDRLRRLFSGCILDPAC